MIKDVIILCGDDYVGTQISRRCRESDLGSTAHSRRTVQARFRSLGKKCLATHNTGTTLNGGAQQRRASPRPTPLLSAARVNTKTIAGLSSAYNVWSERRVEILLRHRALSHASAGASWFCVAFGLRSASSTP